MKIDANTIRELVIVLVPMILSLTVHEFAHAWSAFKLGDDTASRQGRMTLNPLAHIDPIGTLLIPAFAVFAGGIGLIGWAKPVPVSPYRFRRSVTMRNGMLITALAGPASNLILAIITGGAIMFLYSNIIENAITGSHATRADVVWALDQLGPIGLILSRIFFLNVSLAVFNMLPVPPLDGSRVLPLDIQEKLVPYQMIVFLGLILMINYAGFILHYPIAFISNGILAFFGIFV